jgi:uncharacterized protein (TIGR02996 family)
MDEQAFLAAVLADPQDDAPRLIYADWLDEQGRCEQAEFIRVQMELAATGRWVAGKLPGGGRVRRTLAGRRRARWDALAGRELELRPTTGNWGAPLLGPLQAAQVVGCRFVRGLVEDAWLDVNLADRHALPPAALGAEWPGVKFAMRHNPQLPFVLGAVDIRLGGRGGATCDGLYVHVGAGEPPALRLVGNFTYDPGAGWPAGIAPVAGHHTPTLEGQAPWPLPRGVRLRGLVRPVVAERTYHFVRARLVRCEPEPATRRGRPPATCRVTLKLIPEVVEGRKAIFTRTYRSR